MGEMSVGAPFFISIEGVEGSGKSTVVSYLQRFLTCARIDAVFTREPGGTDFAEQLRTLVLAHHDEVCLPETELLLMFAGRHQHVQHVIHPALNTGKWVVCDRFIDATYAYQGAGRGIEHQYIDFLNDWLVKDCQPHCTLLLDVPIQESFKRIGKKNKDRIEMEAHEFFIKVRQAYLERAHNEPQRFVIIDAQQSHEQVAQQVEKALIPFIKQWLQTKKEFV
jgi:dTMP kinase